MPACSRASKGDLPAVDRRRRPLWKQVVLLLLIMVPVSCAIVLASLYYTEKTTGTSGFQGSPPRASDLTAASGTPSPQGPLAGPLLPALVDDPGSVIFKDAASANILVLGLDLNWTDDTNLPSSKDARSDTMFVLHVTRSGKQLGMLSIPRDLYVDLPGDRGADKINDAYSLGGPNLARQAVMHLLHVPIDHTVVIRIAGAKKLVEALGGVDLKVEKDMDYDDNWGHLHVHLKKGWQHLDAENAVGYARFRHDWEGDRGRMRRQQQFINAVMAELKKPQTMAPETLSKLADIFKQTVDTDMTVAEMVDLARVYRSFDRRRMKTGHIDGEDSYVGQMSVILPPPAEAISTAVRSVLLGEHLLRPSDVYLQVVDAGGNQQVARQLGDRLEKSRGCHIMRIQDLPHPQQPMPSCVVVLTRNPDLLDMVPRLIPNVPVKMADEVPYPVDTDSGADLVVVMGKDWQQASRGGTVTPVSAAGGVTASPSPRPL